MAAVASAMQDIDGALDRVLGVALDDLDEPELRSVVTGLRRPLGRLDALVARVVAALEAAAAARPDAGKGGGAVRDARAFVSDELGMSTGAAKQAARTGRKSAQDSATGRACEDGELRTAHAAIITDTLAHVAPERRPAVEAELLAIARKSTLAALRKAAVRVLAREDARAVEDADARQHERRSLSVWDREDGGLGVSGTLYGEMAEHARTALAAFTRPDTPGEMRTPQQRRADGLDAALAAALRSGAAPTQHGVRPHVLVIVEWSELAKQAGMAELAHGGPVSVASIRHLLRDSTFSRVVLGPDAVPIEVSEAVRTVPAGLWRALLARDGGCRWGGCDAPAAWCDVAHGQDPFVGGGRLSLSNAALLCRRHHRMFDRGGWRIDIQGTEVTFQRGQARPEAGTDPPG